MKATMEQKRADSAGSGRTSTGMCRNTKRGRVYFRESQPATRGETGRKDPADKAGSSRSDGKSPIGKDRSTPPLTKRRRPRSEINRHALEKRRYPDPVFSGRDNSWGDRSDW